MDIASISNDIRYADNRHPVDYFEPEATDNSRHADALARVMVWVAQGTTLRDRGYRAMVVIHCLRPAALDEQTLEEVGKTAGYTRQAVHQLARDFKDTFNYERRNRRNRSV